MMITKPTLLNYQNINYRMNNAAMDELCIKDYCFNLT